MDEKNERQILSHNQVINLILDDLIKGVRRRDIVNKYIKLLDKQENTVNHLIREALDCIKIKDDDDREDIRTINLLRLNDLYSKCYEQNDYKEARSMIDIINKTANLYDSSINLTASDSFKFEFANEEEDEEQKENDINENN